MKRQRTLPANVVIFPSVIIVANLQTNNASTCARVVATRHNDLLAPSSPAHQQRRISNRKRHRRSLSRGAARKMCALQLPV
jgi:hypothetical protein